MKIPCSLGQTSLLQIAKLNVLIRNACSNNTTKIAIIGGSGLDDPDIVSNRRETKISTPYGDPADVLIEGTIAGVNCVLLARHGRKHAYMPSTVPYQANIWALQKLGCTHVLVSFACGSLQEEIQRGDLVVPDDVIDRTTKRPQTFFDGGSKSPKGVCHLPMFPAFNERMRALLISTIKKLGMETHEKGTVVCIEGPRYSTRAESNIYRQWNGSLINMTICPEFILAKEAGLLYAGVAIATDYDCWRDGEAGVSAQGVLDAFAANVDKVKKVFIQAVEDIAKEDWLEDIKNAKQFVKDNMHIA